jgi:hypothetical protein
VGRERLVVDYCKRSSQFLMFVARIVFDLFLDSVEF